MFKTFSQGRYYGPAIVVLGAWILGSAGVFVKTLDMPAIALAGFRLLVPCLIIFAFVPRFRKGLFKITDKKLFLASCITTLRILLWVLGLLWAPITKAIIILFSWPIIFTVLSVIAGQEKPTFKNAALLLLGLIGIVLLQGDQQWAFESKETQGLLCMLASAFLFACNMFIFKNSLDKSSPLEVVFRDSLVGSLVFLPFVIYYLPDFSLLQIGNAILYGFTIGVVGFGLLFLGLSKVRASVAAILAYCEVLSAVLFGALLFNETMPPAGWLGAGCILVAAALVTR